MTYQWARFAFLHVVYPAIALHAWRDINVEEWFGGYGPDRALESPTGVHCPIREYVEMLTQVTTSENLT